MTGAAAAKYEWAVSLDGEEWSVIDSETDETFDVTADLEGMYIKVTVTAEDEETASDVTTEPVGVYEALEILSAEQKAQKEVEVTFSAPVTDKDKLTVTKGGNAVEFTRSLDADFLGATLTFTDALTTGTYTVTLTPADTTVDPSSVTFEAEKAKLKEIVFLNKVLVMKDHLYNEGYAYIEGRDQFGKKMHLSGLNVVSGVGTFQSYDDETGKITIVDSDAVAEKKTGAFLTIKEVPVFVQYQTGTEVITGQETLTVSSRAFLASMEFGEVKKNSEAAEKRLTLNELRSNLWYIEILNAKDQYGDALSADDLNDQADKANPVLFVIPGDTGAFYKTGKFGTLNNKTVLWLLGDANSKPTTESGMTLTITGASGEKFSTPEPIVIYDNPYINELTVDYPDLYEGMTESKKLNFTAVDQYEDPINLWDFKPSLKLTNAEDVAKHNAAPVYDNTKLVFDDVNGMTGVKTEISVSGGPVFRTVEYDTKAKEFKVTIDTNGTEAKHMAVFTTTTAGAQVRTQTVTIGERGSASVIDSSFPSVKTLDPTGSWNINKDIKFIDVNGNTMTRNKNNTLYPYFINGKELCMSTDGNAADYEETKVTDDALKSDQKPNKYVWTVSKTKITDAASALATANSATAGFDSDGEVKEDAGDSSDYYVTVFGKFGDKYYILDSKSVRVTNKDGHAVKVDAVEPSDTLYADPTSKDSIGFKVKLTNKVGETWEESATSVTVGGIFAGTTDGATVNGNIASALSANTTATVPVSVYRGGDLVGTVTMKYSNVAPVATKTVFKYDVVATGNNGEELGRAGVKFDNDLEDTEFIAGTTAAGVAKEEYKIADGVLTITNANNFGDTFTASVQDQYGQNMPGTVFYLNGNKQTSANAGDTVPIKRNVWEFKNDTKGTAFYMTSKGGKIVSVTSTGETTTVTTGAELVTALVKAGSSAAAETIVVNSVITEVPANITIAEGDTLVIPAGYSVTTTKNVTNNGTIRGEYDTDGAFKDKVNPNGTKCGTLSVKGTNITTGAATLTGDGDIYLYGHSLELSNVNVTGDLNIFGRVALSNEVVISSDIALDGTMVAAAGTKFTIEGGSITLAEDTTLDLSEANSYTGLSEAIVIDTDESGDAVEGWSVKLPGDVVINDDAGSETQDDLNTDLAVAEFKNTYKALLDLADDDDWSNNTIDETLLAKALAEFEEGGSVEGLEADGAELEDEYNLLLKIQEWLAIKAVTIPGVTGSNSTASQTTFTMPTVTNVDLTGAEITAYKVGSASESTNLETPVTLASSGSTTVDGLEGLTAECSVVFTIETALGNELEVTVTTEAAVRGLYTVDSDGVATKLTASDTITGTESNIFATSNGAVTLTSPTAVYSLDQYGTAVSTPEITGIKMEHVNDTSTSEGHVDLTVTITSDGEVSFKTAFTQGSGAQGTETATLTFTVLGVALEVTET